MMKIQTLNHTRKIKKMKIIIIILKIKIIVSKINIIVNIIIIQIKIQMDIKTQEFIKFLKEIILKKMK